jgi:serine/threonine protein kinase
MDNRWLWPFELKEKIGQGGMGVVYRARYVKNDREVAVKILPEEIAADKKIAARFERELDVLKKLKHPNIVYCFGGKCEGSLSDQRTSYLRLLALFIVG